MAYLSELHPEIYLTTPRPGGLAKIVSHIPSSSRRTSMVSGKGSKVTYKSAADKSSVMGKSSLKSYPRGSIGGISGRSSVRSSGASAFEAAFLTSTPEMNSREYRIDKVLHTSQWMPPEDDEYADVLIPTADPVVDTMMILSIVLSTIMLMAVDYKDISKDHLRWTLSYLECVKDEFGNYPPNVRGIINQIKLIDETLESFLETEIVGDGMLDAATEAIIQDEMITPVAAAQPEAIPEQAEADDEEA